MNLLSNMSKKRNYDELVDDHDDPSPDRPSQRQRLIAPALPPKHRVRAQQDSTRHHSRAGPATGQALAMPGSSNNADVFNVFDALDIPEFSQQQYGQYTNASVYNDPHPRLARHLDLNIAASCANASQEVEHNAQGLQPQEASFEFTGEWINKQSKEFRTTEVPENAPGTSLGPFDDGVSFPNVDCVGISLQQTFDGDVANNPASTSGEGIQTPSSFSQLLHGDIDPNGFDHIDIDNFQAVGQAVDRGLTTHTPEDVNHQHTSGFGCRGADSNPYDETPTASIVDHTSALYSTNVLGDHQLDQSGEYQPPIPDATATTFTAGVPITFGTPQIAPAASSAHTSQLNAPQAQPLRRGQRTLLRGYPLPEAIIPHPATLEQITRYFPNHLHGEVLDPFMQWGWSGNQIHAALDPNAIEEMLAVGILKRGRSDRAGWITNRLRVRISQLGEAGVRDLLQAPKICRSDSGMGTGMKGHRQYLVREGRASTASTTTNSRYPIQTASVGANNAQQWMVDASGGPATETHSSALDDASSVLGFNVDTANRVVNDVSATTSHDVSAAQQTPLIQLLQGNISIMPQQDCPRGIFWGFQFWENDNEFSLVVDRIFRMMKDCEVMASELADPTGLGCSWDPVVTSAKLRLMGWNSKACNQYIEALTSPEGLGVGGFRAHVEKAVGAQLRRAVIEFLRGLGNGLRRDLQNGRITADLVKATKKAAIAGAELKMQFVRKDLERQLELQGGSSTYLANTVTAASLQDSDTASTGRKRNRGSDADHSQTPSKKVRRDFDKAQDTCGSREALVMPAPLVNLPTQASEAEQTWPMNQETVPIHDPQADAIAPHSTGMQTFHETPEEILQKYSDELKKLLGGPGVNTQSDQVMLNKSYPTSKQGPVRYSPGQYLVPNDNDGQVSVDVTNPCGPGGMLADVEGGENYMLS